MNRKFKIHTFKILFSALLFLISSCTKEYDDFINGPTATSVNVTGVIHTADGTPLSGIPVKAVYHEMTWLASYTTVNKAKGETDSKGIFKLYFEPEENKNDPNVSQLYVLYADLSTLSTKEYFLSSEYENSNDAQQFELASATRLDKGENNSLSITIPRKRMVKVDLRNFSNCKDIEIWTNAHTENCINGKSFTKYMLTNTPVQASSMSDSTAEIPCADNCVNTIILTIDGKTVESVDIDLSGDVAEPIVFEKATSNS